MTELFLNQVVTVHKPVVGMIHSITSTSYGKLPEVLKDESIITVHYVFGQAKQRVKLLKRMGFELKDTLQYNDDRPYGRIKQVWQNMKLSTQPA